MCSVVSVYDVLGKSALPSVLGGRVRCFTMRVGGWGATEDLDVSLPALAVGTFHSFTTC